MKSVELYPHQKKALEELGNGKILSGGVGSGKSLTALAYFYVKIAGGTMDGKLKFKKLKTPTDLYIITTAKKRDSLDWQKEMAYFALSVDPESSIQGIKVVVDSWNNIKKYTEVKDAFFIFDEQRLVGSGAWVRSFLRITKTNRWILLSATPGDVWADYIPVFIANGFYRNRTDFVNHHMVINRYGGFPKVERYIYTKKLEALRDQILVDMPFNRHTTRHREFIFAEYDREKLKIIQKDRWNIFKNEPIDTASEMFASVRRLTGGDPRRLDIVVGISKKHPRLIIFYNFNHELEQLRTLGDVLGIDVAEWNGHKHEEVPEGDRWLYLVQYTSGSEAWNCTTTNAIVFYSLNYSYRITQQSEGRIDRLDTMYTDLYYYYIMTDSFLDKGIMRALKSKKNFNERYLKNKFETQGHL